MDNDFICSIWKQRVGNREIFWHNKIICGRRTKDSCSTFGVSFRNKYATHSIAVACYTSIFTAFLFDFKAIVNSCSEFKPMIFDLLVLFTCLWCNLCLFFCFALFCFVFVWLELVFTHISQWFNGLFNWCEYYNQHKNHHEQYHND